MTSSVNEKVLMKRIDQQIRVTEMVAKSVDLKEVKKTSPKLAAYMTRNISIMLSISSIHLLLIATSEAERKRREMWERIPGLRSGTLLPAPVFDVKRTYISAGADRREADGGRLPFCKKDLSVPVGENT